MKKWTLSICVVILCAGSCNTSYGFEWLDRLIGLDLDNSEGQGFGAPMPSNQPYAAGYAPYPGAPAGYAAPGCNPCATCQPRCCAPQTCYRTVYRMVPVTSYQPVVGCDRCGNQVTAMRPVVTYRMQAQVVPFTP